MEPVAALSKRYADRRISPSQRSGIALEDMCDDEGNFLEEYQKQTISL